MQGELKMDLELAVNSEFSADLVERVPLTDVQGLLHFEHHYAELLRRANETGVNEAYVHYHVNKKGSLAGRVRITGVYLTPEDINSGREFDGIGPGAVEFVEQRYPAIQQLLGYAGSLYTVLLSPVSDKVLADSRR